MPAVLARLDIERDDRGREQIVAGALRAVEAVARVAGGEINHAELGVDGRRLPDGPAAEFPEVIIGGPGVAAELPGRRNGVERPARLASPGIERLQAAADPHVTAAHPEDDHAVVIQRRADDAVAFEGILNLIAPEDLAGALVKGHELGVQPADEHLAVAEGDAAAHPTAADFHATGIEVRLVAPENLATVHADREDIILAGHHVEHAVVHERLPLAGMLRAHAAPVEVRAPHGLHVANVVAIDLAERGVTLVGQAAAVGNPTVHGRRRELLRRERRRRLDRLRVRCGHGRDRNEHRGRQGDP